MWIMTNNGYLSIVSKDCGPADLLVRARRAGDIEKVFPNAKVTRQTDSDYLYRAVLPRDVVKQALAAMIDLIDYPNFKDSVEDRSLHAAYVSVWCAMAGLQHPPPEIERATHARSALTRKSHGSAEAGFEATYVRLWRRLPGLHVSDMPRQPDDVRSPG
jgi:hypothetical protein